MNRGNESDYVRCVCGNIVGQYTKDGSFKISHAKRQYTVGAVKECKCERCGKIFSPPQREVKAERKANRVGFVKAPPGFNETLNAMMGGQRIVLASAV